MKKSIRRKRKSNAQTTHETITTVSTPYVGSIIWYDEPKPSLFRHLLVAVKSFLRG